MPDNHNQPLPPIATLPLGIYPPSSYPPPSFFSSTVLHPALVIPARRTGEIQSLLKDVIFVEPKRKSVYPLDEFDHTDKSDPNKERKLVLLRASQDTEVDADSIKNDAVFQDPRIQSLLSDGVRKSHISLPASPYELLTVDQVLRRLLPTSSSNSDELNSQIEEIPSSFEVAGHIAHVNLRSESLPYKYLIGKAIADKNPKIKLVVNKVGNIDNEFRTFPMEILAGEGLDLDTLERLCAGETAASNTFTVDPSAERGMQIQFKVGREHRSLMEVEVKEHGCRFKLDFANVYWNSRLQGEHARLVHYIVQSAQNDGKKECIVADAMAGVGPFAVPLTSANAPHFHSTRIVCHANDLNPTSYKYLQLNAKNNKCHVDRLITYNLDARHFIRKMNEEQIEAHHYIMNLPQLAPEFLDAFRGWEFRNPPKRPMVHVHCFDEKARNAEDAMRIEKKVLQRCEAALGCTGSLVDAKEKEVRVIRDVGPRKNMLCVSFRLPLEVGGVEKLVLDRLACDMQKDSASQRCGDKRAREDEDGSLKRSKES